MKHLIIILLLTLPATILAQSNKSLTWLGGPTAIIELGSFKLLTDPMFSSRGEKAFLIKKHPSSGKSNVYIQRFSQSQITDTSNIDILLISHLHADHFDAEARSQLNKKLGVVAPISNTATLKKWGFYNTKAITWNDTITYEHGMETLKIIAVKALHAKQTALNEKLGKVNGYILEYNDGSKTYRIYWSGDTVWYDELEQLKKYGSIDLFIPNMGAVGADGNIGRRGLHAIDALKIMQTLHPKLTVPIHHSTFSHYTEPISVLQNTVDKKDLSRLLCILKENSKIYLQKKQTMTNTNSDTWKIHQLFLTKQNDKKNSSIITLNTDAELTLSEENQRDIYVMKGVISINNEVYGSGTYISTAKALKIIATSHGAKFFLYQEPLNHDKLEITVRPEQHVWRSSGIVGMKNTELRTSGHSLMLVSWESGTRVAFHNHPHGEEILVLKGKLLDRESNLKSEEWIRMNPNTGHAPHVNEKTLILLRNGHL